MNFKLTKKKIIGGIIISIIVNFIFWVFVFTSKCMGGGFCSPPISTTLVISMSVMLIIGIVVIYVIWSLIQKKRLK